MQEPLRLVFKQKLWGGLPPAPQFSWCWLGLAT